MSELTQLVVFRLDTQRYALPLSSVDRIVRAVEVTALPGAPAIVIGVIDVEGVVVPVLNLRRRFGLPEREIVPADHFLIAQVSRRMVVVAVDEAQAVIECSVAALSPWVQPAAGPSQLEGVAQLEDGLVLIHNLESALSLREGEELDAAITLGATDAI